MVNNFLDISEFPSNTARADRDTRKVLFMLNGIDISPECEITPYYIIYRPPGEMKPGEYTVRAEVQVVDGADPFPEGFRLKA